MIWRWVEERGEWVTDPLKPQHQLFFYRFQMFDFQLLDHVTKKRFRTRIKIHTKSADFLASRQWLTYEITPRLTLVKKKQNNKTSFSLFYAFFYVFSFHYGSLAKQSISGAFFLSFQSPFFVTSMFHVLIYPKWPDYPLSYTLYSRL